MKRNEEKRKWQQMRDAAAICTAYYFQVSWWDHSKNTLFFNALILKRFILCQCTVESAENRDTSLKLNITSSCLYLRQNFGIFIKSQKWKYHLSRSVVGWLLTLLTLHAHTSAHYESNHFNWIYIETVILKSNCYDLSWQSREFIWKRRVNVFL